MVFMAMDPIKDGWNWFAYANNNPIKYVDPTGLFPELSIDTILTHLESVRNVATSPQANAANIQEQNQWIMGFMRYPQYDGFRWAGTAGPINQRFVRLVRENERIAYDILARENLHMRDHQNNLVDLKHLFATLDAQFNPMASFRYAAGIAGDFATHIARITFESAILYQRAIEYFDIFVCQDPENPRSSPFPWADMFANVDAVNIHALMSSDRNLSVVDAFRIYYENSSPINSARYRFTAFYYNLLGLDMPTNIGNANLNVTKLETRLRTVLAPSVQLVILNRNFTEDDAIVGAQALAWIIVAEARNERQ